MKPPKIISAQAVDDRTLLSREAQLFVGWVSGSVTHADVGFHTSTQPTSVLYLIPPTYLVKFSNFEVKTYDISQLLHKPMFSSLQNPGFFKNFSIDLGGYGLIWNDEIDISEYELWQNGVSLTGD